MTQSTSKSSILTTVQMRFHGISHVRGKQYLYEEGIHVPLVLAGPGVSPNRRRSDLVEHIDIAALSLGAAGIRIPASMQARDILSPGYRSRTAIFSARDRCDETVDHLRCVRTERYKYIRNYLPNRPHLQPNAYKDNKAILMDLRKAGDEGILNDIQKKLLAPVRPPEELYDLEKDPFEVVNLAASASHQQTLRKLRKRLADWEVETGDQGVRPEPVEMFDSDMKVYLDTLQKRRPERLGELRKNIEWMKKRAAEGK